MSDVIELAKSLKEELLNLPLFQEYLKTKKEVESNSELKEKKKQIIRAKNENRLDDHKALLDSYNNHPLMVNYSLLKEEVANYLREISEILNEK